MGDLNSYLKKGAEIEIREADSGGSWYMGTVLSRSRTKNKNNVFVEYKTLMNEKDGSTPLREKVDLVQLRPPAPRETSRVFRFGEHVDAYYDDAWWEGVISSVHQGCVYTVCFRGSRQELKFRGQELRLHREWVKGVWVPPLEGCVRQEEPRKNGEWNGMMNGIKKSGVANGSVKPEISNGPVISVNKNWIVGLWLLMVLQICLVIYMDFSVFYLLLRDNPEDLLYGLVVMLVLNWLCGAVVASQLQWLVQRSEYAHDVPWWCYGCTSSTRPKKPFK